MKKSLLSILLLSLSFSLIAGDGGPSNSFSNASFADNFSHSYCVANSSSDTSLERNQYYVFAFSNEPGSSAQFMKVEQEDNFSSKILSSKNLDLEEKYDDKAGVFNYYHEGMHIAQTAHRFRWAWAPLEAIGWMIVDGRKLKFKCIIGDDAFEKRDLNFSDSVLDDLERFTGSIRFYTKGMYRNLDDDSDDGYFVTLTMERLVKTVSEPSNDPCTVCSRDYWQTIDLLFDGLSYKVIEILRIGKVKKGSLQCAPDFVYSGGV